VRHANGIVLFVTAIRDTGSRSGDLAPSDEAALGAEGNERLTAWTGAALLLGFAAEGFTLLARYYTKDPAYRRKGPPRLLLRVLGPFMILLTLAVLGTGVGLMLFPGHHFLLERLHKQSFWAWVAVTGVHVLAYVWRLPRLMLADVLARDTPRAAAVQRIVLSVGSGLVGLGLGVVLLKVL